MHDDQHHRGCCQVVKVGREDERSQRDSPQQAFGIARTYPLRDKVEATIVVQQFNDRHGCQQEHHNSSSSTHIFQEDIVIDEIFYCLTRSFATGKPFKIVCRMLVHDKV